MTATKGPYTVATFQTPTGDGFQAVPSQLSPPTRLPRGTFWANKSEAELDASRFNAIHAAARAPLVELLRECEWVGTPRRCPTCGVHRAAYISHAPGCKLAAALNQDTTNTGATP